MTIVVINNPPPSPPPECPHCGEELPGWSEPSDYFFPPFLAALILVPLLMWSGLTLFSGYDDGSRNWGYGQRKTCTPTKISEFSPWYIGCHLGKLMNKKVEL